MAVASRLPLPANVRGVIFDGDDTLWLTEPLYDEARSRARKLVEQAGLDGDAWEAEQRAVDVANVVRFGHGPERFPTSAVEALVAVGGEALPTYEAVRAGVWQAAASVFDARAPLRREAVEVLRELRRRQIRLGLLTKGDEQVQIRRIGQSGLAELFDHIVVVPRKIAADFLAVAHALALEPGDIVSVGNSVESDVRPSLDAGIYAVWIPAHVWEYERHDPSVEADLHRATSLKEVLALLPD